MPSGSGQERPASPSREKASETVEFETPIAREIARFRESGLELEA